MNFLRKQTVEDNLTPGRVLVIYGPRRVGKTTMVKKYLESLSSKTLYETGDNFDLQALFKRGSRNELLDFADTYDTIVIDEAQMIPRIGLGIKIIIDARPEKNIILTGSSALLLSEEVGSPLLGRHFEIKLLPLSWNELVGSNYEKMAGLENHLIYGAYPEVILANTNSEREMILKEIVRSYLFKDAFIREGVKSSHTLVSIVKALAFQIGSEVSLNEIAKIVGVDIKTVARYIDVLEKSFIIKRVSAFSRNPRNEISKKVKYYFYDLGIRNALVSQFQSFENRDPKDIGALFENYVFMELYKKEIINNSYFDDIYFWRNKKGREVDIVLAYNDKILAYECKWSHTSVSFQDFQEMYPNAEITVVSRDNLSEILAG